jgi:GxxExxY protein
MENLKHERLTGQIIGAFFRVYGTLSYGFLERVYENALLIELQGMGLQVANQQPIEVYYQARLVGSYFADLVVNGEVVIELKAAEGIVEAHEAQVLNYLKATSIEVGLLLNFGPKPQFRRKIFSNERKRLAFGTRSTRMRQNDTGKPK